MVGDGTTKPPVATSGETSSIYRIYRLNIFKDAHRGRVYVYMFIGMSVHVLWVSELYHII